MPSFGPPIISLRRESRPLWIAAAAFAGGLVVSAFLFGHGSAPVTTSTQARETTGHASAAAPPAAMPCEEQTWPYRDRRCLDDQTGMRRRDVRVVPVDQRPEDGLKAVLETKAAATGATSAPTPETSKAIVPAVADLSIAPLTAPTTEARLVDEPAPAGGSPAQVIVDPQERALLEPPASVTNPTTSPEPVAAPVRPTQAAPPKAKKPHVQARTRDTKKTPSHVARSSEKSRTARGEPDRVPDRARQARGEPRVVRRWVEYYDERGEQVEGPSPVTTYPRAEEPRRPTFWRY
jgi:hypothetical protein